MTRAVCMLSVATLLSACVELTPLLPLAQDVDMEATGRDSDGDAAVQPDNPTVLDTVGGDITGDVPIDPDSFVQVVAGSRFTLLLQGNGVVYGWGAADYGELPGASGTLTGPRILEVEPATSVAAGNHHACLLDASGTVWCWGRNQWGQVGDPENADPVEAPKAVYVGARKLFAGSDNTCVVTEGWTLECWGRPLHVPDPLVAQHPIPQELITLPVADVHVGDGHICALAGGSVLCRGDNSRGAVGVGASFGPFVEQPTVVDLAGVTDVGGGRHHQCAITTIGIACWGDNEQLQSGADLAPVIVSEPLTALAPSNLPIAVVSGGTRHNCVLDTDGLAFCCGNNKPGLSSNSKPFLDALTIQNGVDPLALMVSGDAFACGVTAFDKTVWCWGEDTFGQLGQGAPGLDKNAPVEVVLPTHR